MLGLHCCRGFFSSYGEWGLLSGCGEGDDSLAVVRQTTLAVVSGDDSVVRGTILRGERDDSLSVVRGTTLCLW